MLYEQIQEAKNFILKTTDFKPQFGIILGTGLGNLTDEINIVAEIPYHEIPHFPVSTVESHKGKLIFGYLSEKPVVVMAGRFHYYEGYTMKQVTFPVRVMKALGVQKLFITNVAGSTNGNIEAGDLVLVRDHINLHPENPLRGDNDERLGVRFPDMLQTYNQDLIQKALAISQEKNIRAFAGVYVALQGPNLETPAEYRFLNIIGGDVVGMSTVPEVLVARHSEMEVFVISLVSNKCFPLEEIKVTSLESVIAVANEAEPKMRTLILDLLNIW